MDEYHMFNQNSYHMYDQNAYHMYDQHAHDPFSNNCYSRCNYCSSTMHITSLCPQIYDYSRCTYCNGNMHDINSCPHRYDSFQNFYRQDQGGFQSFTSNQGVSYQGNHASSLSTISSIEMGSIKRNTQVLRQFLEELKYDVSINQDLQFVLQELNEQAIGVERQYVYLMSLNGVNDVQMYSLQKEITKLENMLKNAINFLNYLKMEQASQDEVTNLNEVQGTQEEQNDKVVFTKALSTTTFDEEPSTSNSTFGNIPSTSNISCFNKNDSSSHESMIGKLTTNACDGIVLELNENIETKHDVPCNDSNANDDEEGEVDEEIICESLPMHDDIVELERIDTCDGANKTLCMDTLDSTPRVDSLIDSISKNCDDDILESRVVDKCMGDIASANEKRIFPIFSFLTIDEMINKNDCFDFHVSF